MMVKTLVFRSIAILSLLLSSSSPALAATSPFSDLDRIASRLRVESFSAAQAQRTVKIAILDNGFRGHQAEIGQTLPASTQYHAGPVPVNADTEEAHGLFMAQLISGLLAKTPQIPYELHLFSAFGYSNLERAVQTVTSERFDVVLYAQVWEYGGNGDGRGFINTLVNQATSAGVIWINAAGNFGDSTYRRRVETSTDDWAKLPGPNDSVRVRCTPVTGSTCHLRAVLSWNDFKDDVNVGTEKDLDLVLADDTLRIIRTSGLQQVMTVAPGSQGTSLYPREIVEAEVQRGVYLLRVKIRSQQFTAQDELRLLTSGDGVQLLNANNASESLLPPADNASVITIGANDSPKSARSDSQGKPELLTPSLVTLRNGEHYKGSSNSAAIAVALATLVKAVRPSADRAELLALLSGPQEGGSRGNGLPLDLLQFSPTGAGCFMTAALPTIPAIAISLMRAGAVGVVTDAGYKIMTSADPFTLFRGVRRRAQDDMLVVDPSGVSVAPRSSQRLLPQGSYEIVQLPQDQSFCSFDGTPQNNGGGAGSLLRLPSLSRLGQ